MKFHIGTCGYDYPEWVGENRFYPPSLAGDRRAFLTYYASQFPLVELNFTYYSHTTPPQLDGMLKRVRPDAPLIVLEGEFAPRKDFRFSIKAYRELTHEIGPGFAADAAQFKADISPLRDAKKLAAVVFQFPPFFTPRAESGEYLTALADIFADTPSVFEFRHSKWFTPQAAEELRRRNIPMCWVDAPAASHLPRLFFPLTGGFAYARFHGRNESNWWARAREGGEGSDAHLSAEGAKNARYDYSYTQMELTELAKAIAKTKAADTHILFNNHVAAKAPANARNLEEILADLKL